MADQAGLICVALAMLHCVTCLHCDTISLFEDTTSRAGNSSVDVVGPFALALAAHVLQLVATAVVVIFGPRTGGRATKDGEELYKK